MFLARETDALFLYHRSEKLGETSRNSLRDGKEMAFGVSQTWTEMQALPPLYKLSDL